MSSPVVWWTVLLTPLVLAALAGLAAAGDALLAARADGRPAGVGAAAAPLSAAVGMLLGGPRAAVAADRVLWRLGVLTVPVAAVLAVLVVPFAGPAPADLDVGVVWFNAMEVATWAALWLCGWGPNAAFSLVGGYRFIAQGLAYELPLMFSLISVAAGAGSLRVADVAAAQRHLWFAVWMPVAFVVYLISVLSFSFLGPFDYPAGRDIAGGVLGEAAGPDRLMLHAGRWLLLTAGAAMAVPLFLGGGAGPGSPGWWWSLGKTLAVLGLLVIARRRVPTVRADRYVELAWVVLIPATIVQALVAALVALW